MAATSLTRERLQELRRIAAETTPGTYEWRIIETALALTIETALALLDRIEALEQELDAARGEAERWKRRHDALRAAVIKADALIVDAIHRTTAMYNYTQDPDYESHSDGLDEALMILRLVLSEVGGDA